MKSLERNLRLASRCGFYSRPARVVPRTLANPLPFPLSKPSDDRASTPSGQVSIAGNPHSELPLRCDLLLVPDSSLKELSGLRGRRTPPYRAGWLSYFMVYQASTVAVHFFSLYVFLRNGFDPGGVSRHPELTTL
jgi:hypothetical protein